MGLLDDAIRDHLDLKRRRGADPAEVERAEREALGPVRRNPIPGEAPGAEEGSAADNGVAYDQAGDESWSHDSVQEPVADAGAEPGYAEPPLEPVGPPPAFDDTPEAPPLHGVHDRVVEDDGEPDPEESAHEPFPADPVSARPVGGDGRAGPDTAEYNVEDALAAQTERRPDDDGEDVLEETPEFLQDTPEHDRLWFEQRPPKDFDFDE